MFINPKHNPLLARMDHCLFLARRGDEVVGRISAHINPLHNDHYNETTGHFGLLDTLRPDEELVHALLKTAEDWLRDRGMTKIGGPYSFSVNDECGLLIDGFDTPPMIMMPHGRPDYGQAMDKAGYAKAMDTFAFRYDFAEEYYIPPQVQKLKTSSEKNASVSVRPMDMKNFKSDVALVLDIFNDAWSQNWGFIPFDKQQIDTMASEMRALVKSDSMFISSIDGEAVAFALFLPDINDLAAGLDGHLLPFGWAKFLYRLKVSGPKRSRMLLAGLRRKYQKTIYGVGAISAACESAMRAQHARGVRTIEGGWVLETNRDLIRICKLYDMDQYKTYRLYEKPL